MYEKEAGYRIPDPRYADAEMEKRIAATGIGREEFEPKVRKRRTLDEQIEFNHMRLCELEKAIDCLRDKLGAVMVDTNTLISSGLPKQITEPNVEVNSLLMNKLFDSSDKISWLIECVRATESRVQL